MGGDSCSIQLPPGNLNFKISPGQKREVSLTNKFTKMCNDNTIVSDDDALPRLPMAHQLFQALQKVIYQPLPYH